MSFLWQRVRRWLGPIRPCRGWAESKLRGNCEPSPTVAPIAEPWNAWSNAAYPATGLLTWAIAGSAEAAVFAATMALLGVGSFLYHAHPSVRSAALDHAGMYAVFTALATYAAAGGSAPALPWFMAGAAIAAAWVFRYAFVAPLNAMMGLFLWIAGVAAWGTGSAGLLVTALALFAWAMVAWQLDKRGTALGRYGHATWHLGTAIALGCVFLAQG